MVRFSIPAISMMLIASLSFPATAQAQEQCMDCYEKETITVVPGPGLDRSDFEASCADTFPARSAYHRARSSDCHEQ
jgi:hypothetical protein